jgi:uncharacterized protein (DUF427 family)
MTDKIVKHPSTEHPIVVEPHAGRITVTVAGRMIADTKAALTLREAAYPAVHYIPRADVDMTHLTRTEHATWCPYKGDCAYYSIPAGGDRTVNAVWTYEDPNNPVVAPIRAYLAFYPDRVAIAELPGG